MTDLGGLGVLDTTGSATLAINDSNIAVGWAQLIGSSTQHACFWNAAQQITDLGTLGGANSQANGINSIGQIVGSSETGKTDASGNPIVHAFLWGSIVGMQNLTPLPGGTNCFATGINASASIVGYSENGKTDASGNLIVHAVIWQNGVITDLGTLGGDNSQALGVNDSGQIVGWANLNQTNAAGDGQVYRATLWKNSTKTNLGVVAGYESSKATGVNVSGQVVGHLMLSLGGGDNAFRWTQALGIKDLNVAINPDNPVTTNTAGKLVYTAASSDGSDHAFLWVSGTATDLGTLGGFGSQANALNSSDKVVGSSSAGNFTYGFVWDSSHGMVSLGAFHYRQSSAYALNNVGQVAGASPVDNLHTHGFLWQNNLFTDLGTLGGDSIAFALNSAGQTVGQTHVGGNSHAFLFQNGTLQDLGTLPGQTGSVAYGINDSGQIVGDSNFNDFRANSGNLAVSAPAFLLQNGTMTSLGVLSGDAISMATGINAGGKVVGSSSRLQVKQFRDLLGHIYYIYSRGDTRAFLWQANTLTALPSLGGTLSQANAINAKGQVVGVSTTANSIAHAVLWANNALTDLGMGVAYGLNSFGHTVGQANGSAFLWLNGLPVDLNSQTTAAPNWTLLEAHGINDAGQIVGTGLFSGEIHGFLLNRATFSVSGTVTLDSCVNMAQPIRFEFRPNDGSAPFTRTATLASNGNFTLNNVFSGSYKLAIKGVKWLQKVVNVDTSLTNVTGVKATLLPGDINDDNLIGLDDLGLLADAFDTKPGDALWNPNADLNCDGVAGLDDLGILANYFDMVGDP